VLSLEDQAIADVKAAAEKEAAFVARQRAIMEEAAEIERQKMLKARAALERAQTTRTSFPEIPARVPDAYAAGGRGTVAPPKKKAEPAAEKAEPVAKEPEPPAPKKAKAASPFAMFQQPAKPVAKKAPVKPAAPVVKE